MTSLSININKIATLRNSRGENNPNLIKFAKDSIRFGVDGITIHPRPDQRHIKYKDVFELAEFLPSKDIEYNIEGFPNKEFIEMVLKVKPTQVTLVPDANDVLTSNQGWNVSDNYDFLKEICIEFKKQNIRSSIFLDNNLFFIDLVKKLGANRIELFTGLYAKNYNFDKAKSIKPYIESANHANDIGLEINAGHDLSLHNLKYFSNNIQNLKEVSIGHALICDSLYFGIENTIMMYKRLLY